MSDFKFQMIGATGARGLRALLFVALSGAAVPACQYEGGTDASVQTLAMTAPASVVPVPGRLAARPRA